MGDPEAVEAGVAHCVAELGGLDILVNNAATSPWFGPVVTADIAAVAKTWQTNQEGPLRYIQTAWAATMADKGGVILNVASVGGLKPTPGIGVYNISKAALIHMTRQLAGELGPTRVVGIAPGLVKTDFAAVLVANYGDSLAKSMPTGRLGEPQDIANLATFLASDMASWITGDTYVIDGGAGVRTLD